MGKRKNGKPTKANLAALERAFRAKQEKMLRFGVPNDPEKRHELNEARDEFRREWNETRQAILDQYEADVETQRRMANPPLSEPVVGRMAALAPVYLPKWERAAGNLVADAVTFEQQGDEAGLRLARQHVGVLNISQQRKATKVVDEALSDFQTDEQREAGTQARSLGLERDRFEQGTAMRQRGMISALTRPLQAPSGQQVTAGPSR